MNGPNADSVNSIEELRERWKSEVTWSDGVFDSLERFVSTKPPQNIEAFVGDGELQELYNGFQLPDPEPSKLQVEYMHEYAKLYQE